MSARTTRWVVAAAIAALILGAILSRVIEPGGCWNCWRHTEKPSHHCLQFCTTLHHTNEGSIPFTHSKLKIPFAKVRIKVRKLEIPSRTRACSYVLSNQGMRPRSLNWSGI